MDAVLAGRPSTLDTTATEPWKLNLVAVSADGDRLFVGTCLDAIVWGFCRRCLVALTGGRLLSNPAAGTQVYAFRVDDLAAVPLPLPGHLA